METSETLELTPSEFTPEEQSKFWPQWIPSGEGKGEIVASQEDHRTRFPKHYEEFVSSLTPAPHTDEERTAAVLAEREACIQFVENYPTGQKFAREVAKALREARTV